MATFKRFENQEVVKGSGKSASTTFDLVVGDVCSVTSAGVIAKLSSAANIETALGNGYLVLLVAEGSDVANKVGTEYKTYKLNKKVTVPASTGSNVDVYGYAVTSAEEVNI